MKPMIRFKEFNDAWEKEVLINIVDRVIRKNKNSQEELVLTISADHGIISQLDFFNKSVSGKDLSGYYLIKRGEFAYNKSYSNGYPFGVIKRLDNYPQGLLSSLYIIFSPKHTVIDSNYLLGYYQTTYWHKEILKISTEGARNHGLLNISIHDFFNTQLIITNNIAEQEKIGIYIQNVEKLISLYERKLKLLELIKKGFLQKLFINNNSKYPEIRFKEFNDAWERRKLAQEVEFYNGLTYSPKDVSVKGTLVLRSSNVNNGQVVDADNIYVHPKSVNSCNVREGDIIVVVRNGSRSLIGKHAQIKKKMDNTVIGAFMMGIRSTQSEFINALMDTQEFKKEIEKNLGATINQITKRMFCEMTFMFSCKDEQKRIGLFFTNIDNLIVLYERKLELLESVKRGFLENMFI